MKNLLFLFIGLVLGIGIMLMYGRSSEQSLLDEKLALQQELAAAVLTPAELEETQKAREAFLEFIANNDEILLPDRGERISMVEARKRIKNYTDLRDLIHLTKPSQGKELGGGVAFGLKPLRKLLEDIDSDNKYRSLNDSTIITGIRAHYSLIDGISRGHSVDYLDVILIPCTIKGESVFEWKSPDKPNDPPALDKSNPCPDVCP